MLQILLFYDVQEDRLRNKIIEICRDYGLDREQYSVFLGTLSSRQLRLLGRELHHIIDSHSYVMIVPVGSSEWKKRIEIGVPLHVHG